MVKQTRSSNGRSRAQKVIGGRLKPDLWNLYMNREAFEVRHVDVSPSQAYHNIRPVQELEVKALFPLRSDSNVAQTDFQAPTHIVVGTVIDGRDIDHFGAKALFNLLNE